MSREGRSSERGGGFAGSVLARGVSLLCLLWVASVTAASPAGAQNLEEYDYENLGFRALGVDVVYADATDAQGAVGFGLRADLGFLGPYVRVVPRFAFWKADIDDKAVTRFEDNLERLCVPPECSIDLGSLQRHFWVLGLDLQWTLPERKVAPYLGVGVDAYLLDDSGPAIKGTFLDDAVVTAGLSAVAGLQIDVGRRLRVYGDVRGTLLTSASNLAGYAGLAYRF